MIPTASRTLPRHHRLHYIYHSPPHPMLQEPHGWCTMTPPWSGACGNKEEGCSSLCVCYLYLSLSFYCDAGSPCAMVLYAGVTLAVGLLIISFRQQKKCHNVAYYLDIILYRAYLTDTPICEPSASGGAPAVRLVPRGNFVFLPPRSDDALSNAIIVHHFISC